MTAEDAHPSNQDDEAAPEEAAEAAPEAAETAEAAEAAEESSVILERLLLLGE
jgi:hypothetical protein